jgi:hypothetical protein
MFISLALVDRHALGMLEKISLAVLRKMAERTLVDKSLY